MSTWSAKLSAVQQRLDAFDPDAHIEEDDGGAHIILQILQDTCAIVRDADTNTADDLKDIVEKARYIIERGIAVSYGEADLYEFMPSFAHDDDAAPVVSDTLGNINQGIMDAMTPFFRDFLPRITGNYTKIPPLPGPGRWDCSIQPHASTTRLSRFRSGISISTTEATPLANIIYQARCEIYDEGTCLPNDMALSPNSLCLAISAAGGWKNRDPVVHYLLDQAEGESMLPAKSFKPGLSEVAYTMALDEDRKLIFVADSQRVKSFQWESVGRTELDDSKLKGMSTLNSVGCRGPVAVLPNGRLVRAGKGRALVWEIDKLETHGADGNKRIGDGTLDAEGSWRDNDDGDEIELSMGSKPHTTVEFADQSLSPGTWHLHKPSGHMLCGENGLRDNSYSCVLLDLEHGGKTVTRYLGHGGDVECFSTSDGDPNTFVTAGSDGYARLFDIRHPLPVVTYDPPGSREEFCPSIVFVHPDGIPTIFTGGQNSQAIKMWDVRARAVVYDLSTGNNAVVSMAWDSKRSSLWAATECGYMDRLGYTHDYRHANVPAWAEWDAQPTEEDIRMEEAAAAEAHDEDDEGETDDEYTMRDDDDDETAFNKLLAKLHRSEDDDDDEDRCWPKKAYHRENYYGYCFDAGDHRLFQYKFKADSDPKQLPVYGDATIRQSFY
ncbi:uncharacterized protein FIBRA_00801 [Fibroporia radiculosa]|uniref:Uncharacterized protein n=1 Tax=Fibroporia radiculosa TaxID=599839 RepID=J4I850_9APHY|nr:uncharacterized protein FIBRA_00801 [Fibroporia radiculosa]CCL98796.1 predicted protein [Fibroporia radiculosa]